MPKRTARQEIERAFHVSFKLPEQAAELLDAYRAEVLAEAAALIHSLPSAPETGTDQHWYRFGQNRAAEALIAAAGGAR